MRLLLLAIYLVIVGGLVGVLKSGAEDVFMEATRPDFQKIPIGVFGFRDWQQSRYQRRKSGRCPSCRSPSFADFFGGRPSEIGHSD